MTHTLRMSAGEGVPLLQWHADASHGAHPDFKSHSGPVVKFKRGQGSILCGSDKQKLNTNGSATLAMYGPNATTNWTSGYAEFSASGCLMVP